MALLPTNQSAVIRAAQGVIAQHARTRSGPIVVWSLIDEPEERFAARVRKVQRNWSGRILCAVPTGYAVPDGTQAVEFAAKAHAVLNPVQRARYVLLRGGRGGTKSWAVARSLVLRALVEPLRVLCLREIQRSLKDSSLRLLADQIEMLGLSQYFDVGANGISSSAGAAFLFEGMYTNEARIKSLEGIDACWCEQAEQLSEASWSVLLPTIRKAGSQIVITTNPDLADDPVHARFVLNQPPSMISTTLSYLDNPWCTREMLDEAEYLQRVDGDAFEHIWLGALRQHSDAQVLKGKYEVVDFEIRSAWSGPFLGADWGFSVDPTTLIKSWIDESTNTLYVSHEAYQVECPLDRLPLLFATVPGSRDRVIYADNARPEVINHMRSHGYDNVRSCDKWDGSVQDGILTLRSFERIVIHPRCEHVAQEAKLYSYRVDRTTGAVLPDVLDKNNHCIDALRYSLQERIRRPPGEGLRAWYAQQIADKRKIAGTPQQPLAQRPGVVLSDLTAEGNH